MKICKDVYLVASGSLGFDWTHPADCNVYAIDTGAGVVLFDSGTGLSVDDIEANLRSHGLNSNEIKYIFLTHLHADHSGGAAELRRRTGAKVAAIALSVPVMEQGEEEKIDLRRARDAGFYPADYKWNPCKIDTVLHDGETITIGRYSFQVIYTPGHSAYDTSFLVDDSVSPMLISGDTVMYGGKISMLSTNDFSLSLLADSMRKLAKLQPELLLPGHGQPALRRAHQHIRKAHQAFSNLGVPANIG